jgi:NAD+ synthetase
VRDFARKNDLNHAVLGLSGGVDSALVAVIAAEALGAAQVTAVAIPSRYSDPRSTTCAQELAQALGIRFEVVELESLHQAAEAPLGELLIQGTAAENIQARLRAMILMTFVNRYGGMLLNTSNKTELALGTARSTATWRARSVPLPISRSRRSMRWRSGFRQPAG